MVMVSTALVETRLVLVILVRVGTFLNTRTLINHHMDNMGVEQRKDNIYRWSGRWKKKQNGDKLKRKRLVNRADNGHITIIIVEENKEQRDDQKV